MSSIICTCNVPLTADNTRPIKCDIHGNKVAPDLKVHANDGYLLVCLCDCKCEECDYIPLSHLIEQGQRPEIFYLDANGTRKKLQITQVVEEAQPTSTT